jgi:hypothetical protein
MRSILRRSFDALGLSRLFSSLSGRDGVLGVRSGGKPHSRVIKRGVLGDQIDARSKEGRFLRVCEEQLPAQIGVAPTFAQTMLIRRAARAMLRLELLDEKAAKGNWTDHDARTFGGLNNAVRLLMREIAAQAPAAAKAKPPDLSDYLATRGAAR